MYIDYIYLQGMSRLFSIKCKFECIIINNNTALARARRAITAQAANIILCIIRTKKEMTAAHACARAAVLSNSKIYLFSYFAPMSFAESTWSCIAFPGGTIGNTSRSESISQVITFPLPLATAFSRASLRPSRVFTL